MYINIIKATYDKPTATIIFSGEKLNAIPLKSETRKECSLLPFLFNVCWNFYPKQLVKNVEGGIQIGKEVKLLLFEDYMILCIENPKDSIGSLLEKISKYSIVTG